jgi:nucleotide-binding universal stress UspA family protein
MGKKMLIAIDGSKGALKALDYVGEHFSEVRDLQLTLFLVLQGVPPDLWDDGHILSEAEKKDRRSVLDKLIANQKLKSEPIFKTALEALTRKGINPEQIERKSVHESSASVAECILTEARTGGYQTLVMGRCGRSPSAHFLMGSTVSKIINHGAGIAICVVE